MRYKLSKVRVAVLAGAVAFLAPTFASAQGLGVRVGNLSIGNLGTASLGGIGGLTSGLSVSPINVGLGSGTLLGSIGGTVAPINAGIAGTGAITLNGGAGSSSILGITSSPINGIASGLNVAVGPTAGFNPPVIRLSRFSNLPTETPVSLGNDGFFSTNRMMMMSGGGGGTDANVQASGGGDSGASCSSVLANPGRSARVLVEACRRAAAGGRRASR